MGACEKIMYQANQTIFDQWYMSSVLFYVFQLVRTWLAIGINIMRPFAKSFTCTIFNFFLMAHYLIPVQSIVNTIEMIEYVHSIEIRRSLACLEVTAEPLQRLDKPIAQPYFYTNSHNNYGLCFSQYYVDISGKQYSLLHFCNARSYPQLLIWHHFWH